MHWRNEHVWVAQTGVWGDAALPGLLLAWDQDADGAWRAWVITAEPGIGAHESGPYVHQHWVPAAAVRPFAEHDEAPPPPAR